MYLIVFNILLPQSIIVIFKFVKAEQIYPTNHYHQLLAEAAAYQQQQLYNNHLYLTSSALDPGDDVKGTSNYNFISPSLPSIVNLADGGINSGAADNKPLRSMAAAAAALPRYRNGNILTIDNNYHHLHHQPAGALLTENLIDIDNNHINAAATGHLDLFQTSKDQQLHHLPLHYNHYSAPSSYGAASPPPLANSHLPPTSYQQHPLANNGRQATSVNNNSSLAINQLLSFIDQSLPFIENSKTLPPSKMRHHGHQHHHQQQQQHYNQPNQRHQSAAPRSKSSSSMPSHQHNSRNHHYHQQHHHQRDSTFNNLPASKQQLNSFNNDDLIGGGGSSGAAAQQHSHKGILNQIQSTQSQPQRQTTSSPITGSNNNNEKLNRALTSSSMSNSKVPQDADNEMIASYNAPRCDKFTPDICVDDFEYPEQAIIDEIHKKRDLFELMYSEIKDNEPLVDGIPRDVEESYNYATIYPQQFSSSGAGNGTGRPLPDSQIASSLIVAKAYLSSLREQTNNQQQRDPLQQQPLNVPMSSSASTSHPTAAASGAGAGGSSAGFICPSEVMYGKPKLAKNKKGLWKVIVNAGEYTQTVRLEKCLLPNKKCQYVSSQNYESRCAQVHSYNRLLVFEKNRGFYIDTFRLPTGCNCHVTRKSHFLASPQAQPDNGSTSTSGGVQNVQHQQNGNRQAFQQQEPTVSSFSSGHDGAGSMLSQTLWSILNSGNGNLSASQAMQQQQPHFGSIRGSNGGDSDFSAPASSTASSSPFSPPTSVNNAMHHSDLSMRSSIETQSAILEHLNQNPQLAANISESVLKQLIDVG